MRKKVLAILLVLIMLVTAFAGCSGNESGGRKEENRKESRDDRDEEEDNEKDSDKKNEDEKSDTERNDVKNEDVKSGDEKNEDEKNDNEKRDDEKNEDEKNDNEKRDDEKNDNEMNDDEKYADRSDDKDGEEEEQATDQPMNNEDKEFLEPQDKEPEEKVINVMAFSDEVPRIVQAYLDAHPELGYIMQATIISTTDGMYQPALDEMLKTGGNEAPDIYVLDAGFVTKYTQGDSAHFAASYDELGIQTDKMIKESKTATYAVEVGTRPSDGRVVALPYQSTGGCFIYRRSIAMSVWGTDDPEKIQMKIGGGTNCWDDFWNAAEELRQCGYGIVSGIGDVWRGLENSAETAWLKDGKIVLDPKREELLDFVCVLDDNYYHNDMKEWQDGWYADMKGEGPRGVLGFFGPAWLVNYTIADNCGGTYVPGTYNGTYGDWAVCNSPVGFFWGGTWLAANRNVLEKEKKEVVADILQWITLDYDVESLQYLWANGLFNEYGIKDTVVSGRVMEVSNGSVSILNGQNMFDYYITANEYASGRNLTQYDEIINDAWLYIAHEYMIGTISREYAIEEFKNLVNHILEGGYIPELYYPKNQNRNPGSGHNGGGTGGLMVTPTPIPLPIADRDLQGIEIIIGDWYSDEGEDAPRNVREEATAKYRDEIFAKYNFSVDKVAVADWSTMQDTIVNSTMSCAPVAHVVEVEYRWIGKMLKYGLCYDLATLEEFDFTEEKWNKSVIEAMTRGDSIYGMSAETGVPTGGIIWNKRLFEEAGIDPDLPYDLQARGEWTWSKFEELCGKLTRDVNNDMQTDIYATASGSGEMLRCLVASTGEDFIGKDSNGKYYNNMSSKAVTDAMDYAVSLYENGYVMPQAEGDNWDYYQTAFQLGKAAMTFGELYMCEPGQMYGDAMQDVIGFVMPPKPDGAENHHSYGNNKIYVIPACYDAETASRIAFAYNVYTMPTPGYEDSKNEIDKYYAYFEDARAVEETIELLTYDGVMYCPNDKIISADTKLSEDIFWRYPFVGTTPEALVEDIRASWDALIAEANDN